MIEPTFIRLAPQTALPLLIWQCLILFMLGMIISRLTRIANALERKEWK